MFNKRNLMFHRTVHSLDYETNVFNFPLKTA